ncbi:hypothetical protein, partial [uncultured Brachyspira sp.]
NFGKLAGIISLLSFIITLILSVLYKNRIDVSLLKAFISGFITIIILYFILVILKKYLGDAIIEESTSNSRNEIDYNAIYDDGNSNTLTDNINNTVNDNVSNEFNPDSIAVSDVPNTISSDKKTNQNYSSSGSDIGDIVFGKPASSGGSDNYSTSNSSSMFTDKKVTESDMLREVHENPENVAKALRTMMSKDKDDS